MQKPLSILDAHMIMERHQARGHLAMHSLLAGNGYRLAVMGEEAPCDQSPRTCLDADDRPQTRLSSGKHGSRLDCAFELSTQQVYPFPLQDWLCHSYEPVLVRDPS